MPDGDEVIELRHSAQSREVFAAGAVKAARFLAGVEKPGLYSMADLVAAAGPGLNFSVFLFSICTDEIGPFFSSFACVCLNFCPVYLSLKKSLHFSAVSVIILVDAL